MKRIGIIIFDKSEVVTQLYELSSPANSTLLHSEIRDLDYSTPVKEITAVDFIEAIAEIFSFGFSMHITEWKICARDISGSVIKEVSKATDLTIELLSRPRQQKLLCKALLSEF